MTQPQLAGVGDTTESATTAELIRESDRLGLRWGLQPATVQDQTHAVFDGDTESIIVASAIGLLALGQRVMVLSVENGSNFVIGTRTLENAMFRIIRNSAQSIPNSTETAVSWTTVEIDTHGGFSSGEPTLYTVKIPGWYQLSGAVGFAGGTATGRRGAFWRLNQSGTSITAGAILFTGGANNTHVIPARTMILSLDVGDQIELMAYQESGAAMNTGTGTGACSMDIVYVRPRVSLT